MLYFTDVPGATQTTNGTPNTANDALFIAAGSGRTVWVTWAQVQGRGAGLTAVSGISFRLEKWTTTASSAGTAVTPSPDDKGYQAAKHTAGYSATTVTSGTGGPTLLGSFGCGSTSPGGWGSPQAASGNLDQAYSLESAATQSIDMFNVSGTASLVFEASVGTAE